MVLELTFLEGVAFLETAGKPFGAKGVISSVRPKRYYTIPRDSLDRLYEELHALLNFFVLEFQRILFAENIFATIVVRIHRESFPNARPLLTNKFLRFLQAFFASFIGYFLIKYIPFWALLLLSTFPVLFVATSLGGSKFKLMGFFVISDRNGVHCPVGLPPKQRYH